MFVLVCLLLFLVSFLYLEFLYDFVGLLVDRERYCCSGGSGYGIDDSVLDGKC